MKCKHTELEILRYNPDGSIVFFCSLCGELVDDVEQFEQENELKHELEISVTLEGRRIC